ncbi:hypothetical protein K523DRAFT_319515 [Schizophyllum commune Tattone D]|nr:hypothetical protein K523DRAFT_319515 [Schizophyllum commune Tattone D]
MFFQLCLLRATSIAFLLPQSLSSRSSYPENKRHTWGPPHVPLVPMSAIGPDKRLKAPPYHEAGLQFELCL